MKFSAWPRTANPWSDVLAQCQHVARSAWEGIWVADHFMPNLQDNSGPTGECWTILSALAASVPGARLGSLVVGNTYRNPAVLAKQVAQVDVISGGRVILGLGAGWQENEHAAYGIPFYTVGGRLRRLEEAVQIVRSLFDNERTTFEGKYYTITDAPLSPKPVQAKLPILIGGGGETMTMRIAAQYADEWNIWGTSATLKQKGEVLERHCEALGRDPAEIKRSCQAMVTISDDRAVLDRAKAGPMAQIAGSLEEVRDEIGRLIEAGVDEFILPDHNMGSSLQQRLDTYDRFMADVASLYR